MVIIILKGKRWVYILMNRVQEHMLHFMAVQKLGGDVLSLNSGSSSTKVGRNFI